MFDYVLALMAAIDPSAPHTYDARTVARAIADVAAEEEPLPGMTRERTMAVLTDHRLAREPLHDAGGGRQRRGLLRDADPRLPLAAQRPRGLRADGRASASEDDPTCGAAPLAPYIGGCGSWTARRMSQARLAQAERIEEKANLARAAAKADEDAARAASSSSSP